MGILQQEELWFFRKAAKSGDENNFENKSLNVHTVYERKLGLLTLFNRRRTMRRQLVYRIVNDYNCPRQLQGYFVLRSNLRGKVLRDNRELHLPRTKTAMGQSTFMYAATKEWNDLPNDHRNCCSLKIFKTKLFKFFLVI